MADKTVVSIRMPVEMLKALDELTYFSSLDPNRVSTRTAVIVNALRLGIPALYDQLRGVDAKPEGDEHGG